MARSFVRSLGAFLPAAAVTGAFIIDLCNLWFRCGCRSWWAGAAAACNVHHAAPPRCPWCASGDLYFQGIVGTILLAQAAAALMAGGKYWRRLLAALALFPVAGSLLALFSGWQSGYWR